jgi:hypothetical protein
VRQGAGLGAPFPQQYTLAGPASPARSCNELEGSLGAHQDRLRGAVRSAVLRLEAQVFSSAQDLVRGSRLQGPGYPPKRAKSGSIS